VEGVEEATGLVRDLERGRELAQRVDDAGVTHRRGAGRRGPLQRPVGVAGGAEAGAQVVGHD
jgi:hypothetical protein